MTRTHTVFRIVFILMEFVTYKNVEKIFVGEVELDMNIVLKYNYSD